MVVENAGAVDYRRRLLKQGLTYEEYSKIRREFIEKNESRHLRAYDDKRGARDAYKYAEDLFKAKERGLKEIVNNKQQIVDVQGRITVGVGFNMGNDDKDVNRKREAKKEWDKAFYVRV